MAKTINTRVQNKHDIEANWNKAENFIPLAGEIIVYDVDDTHDKPRFKVGDGSTNVNDLPFSIKECIIDVTELPNPNDSTKFIINREDVNGWTCYVVESLPETGEVVTNSNRSIIKAYYNKTDNEVYGYANSALGSQLGMQAGWYPFTQISELGGISYGGVITSIAEDPFDNKYRILIKLATGEINEEITYRVLNGTFVHNKMLQNHCVCHTVEWADGPEGIGEPVLSFPDNDFGPVVNGYYNITDNTVYGYFDNITIEVLGYYIDSLDLNDIVKLALKAALKGMSKGWKTMEQIMSLIGTAVSMPWGGIISSFDEVTDVSALYLLLTSKFYFYKNGTWIGTDITIGMPGSYTGAEIFNSLDNIATGLASHAEGRYTQATNDTAHAEGYQAIASGKVSHAEGDATEASGYASHTEGIGTRAIAEAQHVSGQFNAINSDALFIVGNGVADTARSNAFEVGKNGNVTVAGSITTGGKEVATKEDFTNVYITAGLKEGTAIGEFVTAEGRNNIASGLTAHAEGQSTEARGHYTHAEGFESKATGLVAHAEGWGTIASGIAQHVQGKFNVDNPNAAFIVGGGSSETQRKNIIEVDWDGNVEAAGAIKSKGQLVITEENLTWDNLQNKPFGDDTAYLVYPQEYSFDNATPVELNLTQFDHFVHSNTVLYDNIEYSFNELPTIVISEGVVGYERKYLKGNPKLYNSSLSDNEYPFALLITINFSAYANITMYVSSPGAHTVGIYDKDITILDEKFIPDTIARKSDIGSSDPEAISIAEIDAICK